MLVCVMKTIEYKAKFTVNLINKQQFSEAVYGSAIDPTNVRNKSATFPDALWYQEKEPASQMYHVTKDRHRLVHGLIPISNVLK